MFMNSYSIPRRFCLPERRQPNLLPVCVSFPIVHAYLVADVVIGDEQAVNPAT
jgi:hypothetical protein